MTPAPAPNADKYSSLLGWLPPDSKLRAWIQASRLIGQLNLLLPLALAQVLAWSITGHFSLATCVWIHLFGFLDGLFISYANDVADAEADSRNTTFDLFSGGSRVIPEGKLTRKALAVGAFIMLAGIVIMTAFMTPSRPLTSVFTLAGIFLMHGYSYPPLRLSYRGHGEALQAIGLGIVLPLLAYYVQSGELTTFPWLVLVPLLLFGYAGNIASALPDSPSDAACDKRTYPVRLGDRRARAHATAYIAAGIALSAVAAALATTTLVHALVAVALIAVPAGLTLVICVRLIPSADPTARALVRRYVVAAASSINLVFCGWIAALFICR